MENEAEKMHTWFLENADKNPKVKAILALLPVGSEERKKFIKDLYINFMALGGYMIQQ